MHSVLLGFLKGSGGCAGQAGAQLLAQQPESCWGAQRMNCGAENQTPVEP